MTSSHAPVADEFGRTKVVMNINSLCENVTNNQLEAALFEDHTLAKCPPRHKVWVEVTVGLTSRPSCNQWYDLNSGLYKTLFMIIYRIYTPALLVYMVYEC